MVRKSLAGLILILAATGAAGLWWLYRDAPGHPGRIELFGNVDVRQVDLSFRVPGRLAEVMADEGDVVAPGDVVARIEPEDFEDAIALAGAELAVQQALLDALVAGTRPEEIARAEAEVEQARAALDFAQVTFERQRTLAERNIASHQLHDEAKLQVDVAVAGLREAEQALLLLQEGPRDEDIRAARAQRDALAVALQIAQRRLTDTRLIAPSEGHVLTRIRESGAVIAAGEPIFTLSLRSPVWVRTYVDEPDLGHVRPGMSVTVTTDSGGSYEGRVGFISPVAEFTPRTVQTRELRTSLVYRLRVIVENADEGLRQGMPVTVAAAIAGDDG